LFDVLLAAYSVLLFSSVGVTPNYHQTQGHHTLFTHTSNSLLFFFFCTTDRDLALACSTRVQPVPMQSILLFDVLLAAYSFLFVSSVGVPTKHKKSAYIVHAKEAGFGLLIRV
jgi:hypothetical protein